MSLEGLRHPRVLVGVSPNSEALALGNIEARSDDSSVIITLGDEGSRGGREAGVANVDLGIGDLYAEGVYVNNLEDEGEE